MRQGEADQCSTCSEALTVNHFLLYCGHYAAIITIINIPAEDLYETLGPDQEKNKKNHKILKYN